MRRAVIPTLLAVMLVALAASPATAGKPETRTVIPLAFEFGPVVNPCTDQETMLRITAEMDLHALPSIESWFSGDFKHANLKIIGQIEELVEGGYTTEWKHLLTGVINQKADHYVETSAEPLMFYGDDGGKYRVHRGVKLVVVGGEVKVERFLDDAVCVRQPAG